MTETPEISVIIENDAARIVCTGELDLYIAEDFNAALEEAISASDNVTIDMAGVDFIDSAILQSLSVYGKTLYRRGNRMKVLVTKGGYPGSVIKTVGFDCLLDVVSEETS